MNDFIRVLETPEACLPNELHRASCLHLTILFLFRLISLQPRSFTSQSGTCNTPLIHAWAIYLGLILSLYLFQVRPLFRSSIPPSPSRQFMLCLGSGSICDVCLEPFGSDHKAPCSIDCGHVFCFECLNHISRAICPLCRTPFALGNHVKLHVDVDNTKGSPPYNLSSDAATLQEGRRLQEAIASVANQGSSEAGLCQLISDCRTFLSGRPRQEFQDLRVSYRMVSYIYEIKSRLRDKEHAVEMLQASVDLIQAEKAELTDKLTKTETQRRDDREAALAIEMSLRHHCEQTQASYTELVKLYHQAVARIDKIQSSGHHVPEEWEQRQNQQLKNFAVSRSSPDGSSCDSLSPPTGFLISPLPEFTSSALPSMCTFSPLPDDTCEGEKVEPVNLFQTPPDASPGFAALSPGLLSMTAPNRMEDRRPPMYNRSSSRPPTCPPSPKPVVGMTLHSAPSNNDPSGLGSANVGINPPRDSDRLRNRLRDLLDTNANAGTASSLPNLSAHTSSSDGRYTSSRRDSRPPSSDGVTSLSHSVPSLPVAPGAIEATSSSSSLSNPSILHSTAGRPMLSHASTAAHALERIQKEDRREYRSRTEAENMSRPTNPPEREYRSRTEAETMSRAMNPPEREYRSRTEAETMSRATNPPEREYRSRTEAETMSRATNPPEREYRSRTEAENMSRATNPPERPSLSRSSTSGQSYVSSSHARTQAIPVRSSSRDRDRSMSSANSSVSREREIPVPTSAANAPRDSSKRQNPHNPAGWSIGASRGKMISSTMAPPSLTMHA